jgi:hypothetical protein
MRTLHAIQTGNQFWIVFYCGSIGKLAVESCRRGHTVAAVCNSFQLSKDCGFKVSLMHVEINCRQLSVSLL